MDVYQTVLTLTAFILGLMMFSYAFFGDSYAFAFGEAFFLAGQAAISTFGLLQTFYNSTLVPIVGGSIVLFLSFILGATVFTRLTKYRWAARYSTAILSGMGIGVLFGLNIKSQIVSGIVQTLTGISDSLLKPQAMALGGYIVPAPLILVFWIFAGIYLLFMVLTFTYSQTIAGPFFNPKSRLRWVSRIGRIFIIIMLGNLAAMPLINESIDGLIAFLQIVVKRTYDAFQTGISPF